MALSQRISSKNNTTKISSVVREDKVEVYGKNVIRNEYLKELEKRLRNRDPDKDWEDYTKNTNELLEILLNSEMNESPNFTLNSKGVKKN